MYTSSLSDLTVSTNEHTMKSIQGPCGNCTYESLFLLNDSQSMVIPHVNKKELIVEQAYSTINGSFGAVKINILLKFDFIFILFNRFFTVISILIVQMII